MDGTSKLPVRIQRMELTMLTAYVNAAMRKASYEILAENGGFFGRIDGLQGEPECL
jgi:hypothetical protein